MRERAKSSVEAPKLVENEILILAENSAPKRPVKRLLMQPRGAAVGDGREQRLHLLQGVGQLLALKLLG